MMPFSSGLSWFTGQANHVQLWLPASAVPARCWWLWLTTPSNALTSVSGDHPELLSLPDGWEPPERYDFLPVAVTVTFKICVSLSLLSCLSSLCFTSSLLCTDTCDLVATLRGHEASVKSLSLHSSGRFVLAVSSQDSVLWDLDSFARCRTLNGGQEVGVQDVRCQSSLCYF